jgi:hypothetical protein
MFVILLFLCIKYDISYIVKFYRLSRRFLRFFLFLTQRYTCTNTLVKKQEKKKKR